MEVDKNQYYRDVAEFYANEAIATGYKAAIHLEDENDVPFWFYVLKHYAPKDSFHFISYTRTPEGERGTGCAMCLRYKKLGCLSKQFLIAIDSDYRYLLLQEPEIDAAHFVLQTYTYSIENHYSYSVTIDKAFFFWNKFENKLFDFDFFNKNLSNTTYDLFFYYLYSKQKDDNKLCMNDFYNSFILRGIDYDIDNDGRSYLSEVEKRVSTLKGSVHGIYPNKDIEHLKNECDKLGVNKDNLYLHIRGHNLFEDLVVKIIENVYDRLSKEYVEDFSNDEKQVYFSRPKDTHHENFSQNLSFYYPEMKKIGNDIKVLF